MPLNLNYTQQLQRLNEYQKAAVFDESSACLVNANVGSGKTTVLITKVMYLHYEKQIPYEQMVVLTLRIRLRMRSKSVCMRWSRRSRGTVVGLWNISQCVSYDVEENASSGNLGYTKELW